jgi:hypothetical protein
MRIEFPNTGVYSVLIRKGKGGGTVEPERLNGNSSQRCAGIFKQSMG